MYKLTQSSLMFGCSLFFSQSLNSCALKRDFHIKAFSTLQESKKKLLQYTFKALEFNPKLNKPFCDAKILAVR